MHARPSRIDRIHRKSQAPTSLTVFASTICAYLCLFASIRVCSCRYAAIRACSCRALHGDVTKQKEAELPRPPLTSCDVGHSYAN
jgi:hypothetical protein